MGLFDFFTGKKATAPAPASPAQPAPAALPVPAPPPPAAGSPWQAHARQVTEQGGFHWEYKNQAAQALVTGLLTQAAPAFGNGQVKLLPDDREIDLRGTYEGAPIRFAVNMSFGNFGKIAMKCANPNPLDLAILMRDHEKIPKPKDAGDPFSEDEKHRIFLAKGIYVEGDYSSIAMYLATWSKLPPALQSTALAEMERLALFMLMLTPKELFFVANNKLSDLADPIEHMRACAHLLAQIRAALPQGAAQPAAGGGAPAAVAAPYVPAPAPAPIKTLTCSYCSSLFVLTAANNGCPNCGAPARA